MLKCILLCIVLVVSPAVCFALDLEQYNVTLMCAGKQKCIDNELKAKDELAKMRFSTENDRLLQMILNTAGYTGALSAVIKMHIPYEQAPPPQQAP
jgi:hypothetical protein